ncbi:MAG: hypothetical protein ACKVRO_05900 [Micropepsaceae bacterium]
MFNVRLTRWVAASVVATAAFLLPQSAQAAGTAAGTTVSNTATVNFNVGGVPQTAVTGSATFVVDDKVNLTVTNNSGATVVPGSTNQVLAFTLQNTGNKTHGYSLAASLGSGITMNNVRIYRDVNGDGNFDGGDTLYTGGTNAGDLAADAIMRLLIVSDTPVGATNGQVSNYQLIATTLNAGTTTVTAHDNAIADDKDTQQVVFADAAGPGAGDIVRDGKHSATGTYTVSTATLTVTKTSTVVSDPFNGTTNPKRIPGAVVRYSIVVTNTGAANATNVVVRDAIPASTTYAATSITLNAGGLTDAGGDDAGDINATNPGEVTVTVGALASGGGTGTVTFDVTVN